MHFSNNWAMARNLILNQLNDYGFKGSITSFLKKASPADLNYPIS